MIHRIELTNGGVVSVAAESLVVDDVRLTRMETSCFGYTCSLLLTPDERHELIKMLEVPNGSE
jgi:hypothetical protein